MITCFKGYLVFILITLTAGGCLKLEKGLEKEKKRVITEKANLPPSPSFVERSLVERYPDGAYSVEGVVKNIKTLLDQKLQVKATVLTIQKCPPKAEHCEPPPHLFAVDDLSYPRKKLLVVGSGKALEGFEQRQTYTFSGRLSYWSPDMRFIKLDGIFALDEPPPP